MKTCTAKRCASISKHSCRWLVSRCHSSAMKIGVGGLRRSVTVSRWRSAFTPIRTPTTIPKDMRYCLQSRMQRNGLGLSSNQSTCRRTYWKLSVSLRRFSRPTVTFAQSLGMTIFRFEVKPPNKPIMFAPIGRPTRKSLRPLLAAYWRRYAARNTLAHSVNLST